MAAEVKKAQRWVRGKNGKPKKVNAVLVPGVPGLFLNKDPKSRDLGWCITHRASGLRVGPYWFLRRSDAMRIAKALADIEWDIKDPARLMRKNPDLPELFRDLVQECKGDFQVVG